MKKMKCNNKRKKYFNKILNKNRVFIIIVCSAFLTCTPTFAQDAPTAASTAAIRQDILNKANFSAWGDYSQAIQNCTPGTFTVPNVITIGFATSMLDQSDSKPTQSDIDSLIKDSTLTYTIEGLNDNNCQLSILDNDPSHKAPLQKCTISSADLAIVGEQAQKAADFPTTGTWEGSSKDPASQAYHCQ